MLQNHENTKTTERKIQREETIAKVNYRAKILSEEVTIPLSISEMGNRYCWSEGISPNLSPGSMVKLVVEDEKGQDNPLCVRYTGQNFVGISAVFLLLNENLILFSGEQYVTL